MNFDFPDKARFLSRYEKPIPTSDDVGVRLRYLRDFVRPLARDSAVLHLLGLEQDYCYTATGQADTLLCAIQRTEILKWPRELGVTAGHAEWRDAESYAQRFLGRLRKELWWLGRQRATGAEIIGRAQAINDEAGCLLPKPILEETAQYIVAAAIKRPGRSHARR